MCFPGLILSVPTGFPTTNGKAMHIMMYPTNHRRRAGNGFRGWCWIAGMLVVSFSTGCARVTPVSEPTPTDLQVTADSLKAAVREAQRTASELRTELDAQRKELADAQVARAQLQGMLQETERRLADARQIIDLQREELAAARSDRERVAQAIQPSQGLAQQSTTAGVSRRKRLSSAPDGIAKTSTGRDVHVDQSAAAIEQGGSLNALPLESQTGGLVLPPALPDSAATPAGESPVRTVVVRSGDTLWAIAKRHKIGMNALRALNGLSGDRILIGRTLRLPEPRLQPVAIQPAVAIVQ